MTNTDPKTEIRRHKETFFQACFEGVPSHWVVQFYVDDNPFPDAAYFRDEETALRFKQDLLDGVGD